MVPIVRNFILFKTDLFVFQQRDQDIDQWFVGGDCAGWFYARLLPVDCIRPHFEPVMEDWGWTFAVNVDDVSVWVNVWGFYGIENCWLFGVDARKRLFRRQLPEALEHAKNVVRDALDNLMAHDQRIEKYRWFADNPFDMGVNEF